MDSQEKYVFNIYLLYGQKMKAKKMFAGVNVVAGERELQKFNCCFKFHAKGKENNFEAFCSWNNQFSNIWRGRKVVVRAISYITKSAAVLWQYSIQIIGII